MNAGFLFYWGLGGTWGLHEASGGEAPPVSASHQIVGVLIGLLVLALRRRPASCSSGSATGASTCRFAVARFARIGAWVIAAVALGGALADFGAQTDFQRFVDGPVNLIVALLAFVVARSELPVSPRSGAVPKPSGKPGPPTPAH